LSELEVETQKILKITPEEELEKLKNQEAWIKQQINQPDSVLRNIYSTDSPKKDLIVDWATQLERRYELELQLNLKPIVKEVGAISTYIKDELRKLKVHESTLHYVHEVLGVKYKYESKNRYHQEDDENDLRGSTTQTSSNTIADFATENKSLIDTINQQMDFLHNLRNKAKSSRILSALSHEERLMYEETNLRIQATQLFAAQVIDDRQSVPINAQLKLVMAIVAATNNYAAGMYVSQVKQHGANKALESKDFFEQTSNAVLKIFSSKHKKLFKETFRKIKNLRAAIQKAEEKRKTKSDVQNPADAMTSKQAMKIVYGLIKNVIPLFDHKDVKGHHDRDAALVDGHYGLHCPECGSLRVREKEHPDSHEWLCFCYHCEWWFEAKTISKCWNCHIPFFDDILAVILQTAVDITNKRGEPLGAKKCECPRCEKEVILPAKMFQAPKLRGK